MIKFLIERLTWYYYKDVYLSDVQFILKTFVLLNTEKYFRFNQVNLNDLSNELSLKDKGKKQIDNSQMKEFLGILGIRWRNLPFLEFMSEVYAIHRKAGLNINDNNIEED